MLFHPVFLAVALNGGELIAIGVTLIGVALGAAWWRSRRRAKSRPPAERARPMVCPSCGREQPPGTLFCPADARKLVPAETERRAPSLRCPRCRRAFDAQNRFCPFDAEELVPHVAHAHDPHDHAPHDHLHDGDGTFGKICPVCASRYGLEALFCGRDGSELMTVN